MDGGEPLPQRRRRKKAESGEARECDRTPLHTSVGEKGVGAQEDRCDGGVEKKDEEEWFPDQKIYGKYEYLDHTADVQFHTWGDSLPEAMEQQVVCMFSYITDLGTVEEVGESDVEVSAHDMQSLLYAFMDEFLYQFSVDGFVARRVTITSFDRETWKITAKGFGEKFQPRVKHPQGTEIKAITYSAMQILEDEDSQKAEIFVIVDI
uniref:Archease domain-containing protein n=1 Tax=Hemiselmis andersenii TaxID=464988 RepID=A0A7S1EA40_HEMAN